MNNRETATLIWLAIALAACLLEHDIRHSLWEVVKTFMTPKVIGPVLALAAWTVGLSALAHTLGLWETDVRNDAVVWFITVGLALFISLDRVSEGRFFRRTARQAVALTVFVEGFVNLEVLPIWAEFLLLPLGTLLALMAAFSEDKEEYAPVRGVVNGLLGFVGVGVLLYVVVRLLSDFDADHTARALALPVWLTLGAMPFIYVVALWSEYEQAFIRIELRANDRAQRRRAKRALARAAHVRAAELGGFAGHWIGDLASAESDEAARAVMQRWRATWRAERHSERLRDAREYMNEWLTATEPALRDLCADTLRRSWGRLDSDQRAALKAEGLRRAPRRLADAVRALPE